MNNITDDMWRVYYLCHKDHCGLSVADAAKKMKMCSSEVQVLLSSLKRQYSTLFTDISSDGQRFEHGVSRYGGWCEGDVVKKF